jgi:4-O-beta-D-mannosyl-D-glucose phosphorylase
MKNIYFERLETLEKKHNYLLQKINDKKLNGNGIFDRYQNPILTSEHTPLTWRYDFNIEKNPYLMQRIGINAVMNAGAIKWQGKYIVVPRIEAADRKSFFAVAESSNGIDNFTFWDFPIVMPETEIPDTNVYDMRLVQHEDGWVYGLFCTERKDPAAPLGNQTDAIAQCGIARTKNLINWERLPDLKSNSSQQRNVVLHPEFVHGQYAFYTRPQDGFIEAGKGGGISFGLSKTIENAEVNQETLIDKRIYHTISEAKNGLGPAPIKTKQGWLHMAHGVRNTAAGLRYVSYLFMTDLHDLTKIIYKPAGYFMAPENEERIGDVSNVLFCNGWILDEGNVFIYYASSDTRLHVATTTLEQLLDYVMHTKSDGFSSKHTAEQIIALAQSNKELQQKEEPVLIVNK